MNRFSSGAMIIRMWYMDLTDCRKKLPGIPQNKQISDRIRLAGPGIVQEDWHIAGL